jgi:MFS family permease
MREPTSATAQTTVCPIDSFVRRPGPSASRAQQSLNWLNFFVATIGTGFDAFVPAYLATYSWKRVEIGAVSSVDTLASTFAQVPAGALVDAIHRRRALLATALMIIAGAVSYWPRFPMRLPVVLALVLHDLTSSVIGPAITAKRCVQNRCTYCQ